MLQLPVLVWSRNGANRTKAFVNGHSWHQNDDYVGLVNPPFAYMAFVNVKFTDSLTPEQ